MGIISSTNQENDYYLWGEALITGINIKEQNWRKSKSNEEKNLERFWIPHQPSPSLLDRIKQKIASLLNSNKA